jgi:hypothetical protein
MLFHPVLEIFPNETVGKNVTLEKEEWTTKELMDFLHSSKP